ncbi:MAG: hypothetical protein HYR85_18890 [Planctomycetes bacterium]|nr:hypothetical protein [Planctomycetota bacterium]MBI3847344.1 hypothetical protein [Planctomycetota bacterium]
MPKTRRWPRRTIVAAAAIVALLTAAWAFLPQLVRTFAWPSLLRRASDATGLRVAGELRGLGVSPGRASIGNVELGNSGDAIAARAELVDARFDTRTLASGSPHVESIVVRGLEVAVDLDRTHDLADVFSRLGKGRTGNAGARVDRVEVESGVVNFVRRGRTIRLSDVRGEATLGGSGLTSATLSGSIGPCRLDIAVDAQRRLHLVARAANPPLELLDALGVPSGTVGGASEIEADATLEGSGVAGHVRIHIDSATFPEPIGRTPVDVVADVSVVNEVVSAGIERAQIRLVELRDASVSLNVADARAILTRPTTIETDLAPWGSPVAGHATIRVDRFETSRDGDVAAEMHVDLTGMNSPEAPARLVNGRASLVANLARAVDGGWRATAKGDVHGVELAAALGGGTADATVDATARSASAAGDVEAGVTITSPTLGRLETRLRIVDRAVRTGTLTASDVSLAHVVPSMRGTLGCRLAYDRSDEANAHRLAGDVTLGGIGFALADVEADGVAATLSIDGTLSDRRRLDLAVRGNATGFFGVAKKYSIDATITALSLDSGGSYDLDADRLELRSSRVSFGGLVDADVSGSATGLRTAPDAAIALHASVPDFDAAFRALVVPNVQDSEPKIAALRVSGRAEANVDARLRHDAPTTMNGRVRLHDVAVHGESLDLEMLDADVPLGIGVPAPADTATVAVSSLRVGSVHGDHLRLVFRPAEGGWQNETSLEPIRLSGFGGDISLQRVGIRAEDTLDDVANRVMLVADVGFSGLRVSQMIPELAAKYPFDATMLTPTELAVSASVAQLRVRGDTIVSAFGGHVKIGDVSGDHPFSSLARFKTSLTAWDVDLERVSTIFDYGEVRGIVEADVPYVWIGAGELERFLARFRTVDGRSKQIVGLKALQQIPYLSTEGRLTLQGHLANFLGAFRYSKIGAAIALQNGIFQFHGRFDADGNDLFGTPDRFTWPLRQLEGVQEYLLLPAGLLPRLAIKINPAVFGVSFDEFIAEIRSAHAKKTD